ncbi:hypothetical protein GCM10010921_26280 [Microbacterium album]|uniref:GGDEF domain-containing protein n=2 Tax=Microbacterium album TaxID=2053191 RepID=A0A917IGY8_9MICO|nr:hypothetical protein GCM10010921_26280 [Microbacterium album]
MHLDLHSTSLVAALVVFAAGSTFLLETVTRRDSGAGRYWAASFLTGILTVFCYLVWAFERSLWGAVAVGNGAFAAQMGLMWLGCRVFNGRLGGLPRMLTAAASLIVFAAALLDGPEGGDWAGAPALFAAIVVLASLGAVESRRGALRRAFSAIGLTLVLSVAAAFYAGRAVVFLIVGPESALFREWFDTNATSLLTAALTVVAVVSTSVLRLQSLGAPPPTLELRPADASPRDPLPRHVFDVVLRDLVSRARDVEADVAVIAFRIEDLRALSAAFGPAVTEPIESGWRSSVRRHAPLDAAVGHLDAHTIAVSLVLPDPGEGIRVAQHVQRCLLDDLLAADDVVLPTVGVGVAVSAGATARARALVEAAREAAGRSASSPDAEVALTEL